MCCISLAGSHPIKCNKQYELAECKLLKIPRRILPSWGKTLWSSLIPACSLLHYAWTVTYRRERHSELPMNVYLNKMTLWITNGVLAVTGMLCFVLVDQYDLYNVGLWPYCMSLWEAIDLLFWRRRSSNIAKHRIQVQIKQHPVSRTQNYGLDFDLLSDTWAGRSAATTGLCA